MFDSFNDPDDPGAMFIEDLIASVKPIPQMEHPIKAPILRIFARGTTDGTPDFVTERTEVYILGWDDKTPPEARAD